MNGFIGILGATGVGKSDIAVDIAQQLGTDIVSADSMQIYRGMDIGTAKITNEQMRGVTHHMLDVVGVNESYSASQYAHCAGKIIDDIIAKGNTPIVAGGTGLYFYSLVYGLQHNNSTDELLRQQLIDTYDNGGIDALVEILSHVDPAALDVVDTHNCKRVIRAIEIASSGGSVCDNSNDRVVARQSKLFVLNRPREVLYSNIDMRVDHMINGGLVAEVERLYRQYADKSLQSLQAIGYKEIIQYIEGDITLSCAIDSIKQNSRRYAKRQLSYFKRLNAQWIDCQDLTKQQIVDIVITSSRELV